MSGYGTGDVRLSEPMCSERKGGLHGHDMISVTARRRVSGCQLHPVGIDAIACLVMNVNPEAGHFLRALQTSRPRRIKQEGGSLPKYGHKREIGTKERVVSA